MYIWIGTESVLIDVQSGAVDLWRNRPQQPERSLSHDGQRLLSITLSNEGVQELRLYPAFRVNAAPGDSIILIDPFEGYFESIREVSWSENDEFIAVQREHADDSEWWSSEFAIAIYDRDGSLVSTINNGIERFADWSPIKETELLYVINNESNSQTPCIRDVLTGVSNCLITVQDWQGAQNNSLRRFQFSPDAQRLGFNTFFQESEMCTISLSDHSIQCTVNSDDFQFGEFEMKSVFDYGWITLEPYQFIVFHDVEGATDFLRNLFLAVVDADGQNLQIVGRVSYEGDIVAVRPSLP